MAKKDTKLNTTPWLKNLYYILLAITCAVIVHILTILWLEFFHVNKTYNNLIKNYPSDKFTRLNQTDNWIKNKSNDFDYYICPFNIRHKTLQITSKSNNVKFWDLAIYNQHVDLVYSLNNKLLPNKTLNLIIGKQMQISLVNKYFQASQGDSIKDAIMVAKNLERGFAILKIRNTDFAAQYNNSDFIENTSCKPLY